VIIPFARRALTAAPMASGLAAAAGGAIAAWHYHRLGLTLSHYDARGHLVVARRIIDSITPGWQQIGAVWLPLPHLLNAIPVQLGLFYRTGASAVAISIACYAVAVAAIVCIVRSLTESTAAACAAAAVFALNPNVLYLQSTPMTEPMLLAATTTAVAMLISWSKEGYGPFPGGSVEKAPYLFLATPAVGWAFALACLTRFEAWPLTASALAAAAWVRWRRGQTLRALLRDVGAIAVYPALAVVGFAIFSRVVIGEWFVASGFFVPENKALGDPMLAASEIAWGARALSGTALIWIGGVGAALALGVGLASRRRAEALIAVSLLAMAAVPWTAFLRGHPFRIRYMVPLMAIEAIGAGVAVAAFPSRRVRVAGAMALLAVVGFELRPLDASAPMVVEAQWDRPNAPVRARVTACLGRPSPGVKIMASMGSLGHYMQEASRSGFAIGDFLHEGNGDIWLAALERPPPFAEWLLIEEKAEGGDVLARIARERPSFLDGYQRTCEGAGLALYQRARGKGARR
jgi:hypothetical protein